MPFYKVDELIFDVIITILNNSYIYREIYLMDLLTSVMLKPTALPNAIPHQLFLL